MANKIDSNIASLAFAEEDSLKTLPGSPIWYELEPNSYSDFGGEFTTVARNPINPSRQRKKGKLVDLDASGGFNSDLTASNMQRLLQGFFFADAREKADTDPLNGTAVAITNVDGTTEDYDAASGLDAFLVNQLIMASGFTTAANNGVKTVVVVAATALTVDEDLTTEASPPSDAKLEAIGHKADAGDLDVVVSSGYVSLTSTLLDFTTLGLIAGEWIFVGGDAASSYFANNEQGFARIKAIAANELQLDDTTWTPANETGTGLSIELYFGRVIKNEELTALIVRRSYNLERQLGEDDDGVQSEYLEGAIANEFTLNVPQAEKFNVDLSFVALDNTQRSGLTGIKTGDRVSPALEDAFNSSDNLYRLKLNVLDDTLNPTALFAYVSELNLNIKNNVTPNKALGVLGAFDATAGDFEVGGSLTAYFTEVAAVAAVRNNSDVGLSLISTLDNTGFVFDLPLLALGGGRINVEKDQPITMPLETSGAENENGYTLLANFFSYLPSVANPA